MRTSNIVQESQSSREVGENAIAMSIDEHSSVFLMDALGKLYSRPAQAALREYLSNALDAHKAKGGKLPPIQVTLPVDGRHSGNHMLSVRDFGNGMTESQFETILSRYGASTKRDTNKMIGGFGLGAKSGFAISNEFFMTSYQQGRGIRVRIFKDALNKGYIDVIDRFTTKEADGLLVEVPVPNGNVYELSKKVLSIEFPFFMGYGTEELDVIPAEDYSSQSVQNEKSFIPLSMGGKTIGWLGKKSATPKEMYALIGRVAYSIDLKELAANAKFDKSISEAINTLKSFRRVKVIDIPIGAVDLPSSREEITYSERSIKTIGAVLSNFALVMKQDIQKELNTKRTNLQALNFITGLEDSGYKSIHELTWKGQSLSGSLFDKSGMIITTFKNDNYGSGNTLKSEMGKKIRNFRVLAELSSKTIHSHGIFRIMVDDAQEAQVVKKLLSAPNIVTYLGLDDTKSWNSHSAVFLTATKDDTLNDWIFGAKEIKLAELLKIEQTFMLEKKKATEAAEKERVRREQARQRAEKAKATRSQSMLSNFVINNGKGQNLARNTVNHVFKKEDAKRLYWSEAEVEEFANVSKGNMKLLKGRVLFPFIAGHEANSYSVMKGNSSYYDRQNYLSKLRSFLKVFLEEGTIIIVVGKERDLDEFKAEYPKVQSGVLFVKSEIERQVKDETSEVMVTYKAMSKEGRYDNREQLKNLIAFYEALSVEQVQSLNSELLESVERFATIVKSKEALNSASGLDEEFFLNALKGFVVEKTIKENSYSVKEDVEQLTKKYPLLLNGSFFNPSQDTLNDMLEYISMKSLLSV